MSTHTEGPWRVDDNGRDVRAGGRGGLFVARAYEIEQDEPPYGADVQQWEANARLIAAAPDLLAALKRSLNWLASYPGGCASNAYDAARAAIAQAEQEQREQER